MPGTAQFCQVKEEDPFKYTNNCTVVSHAETFLSFGNAHALSFLNDEKNVIKKCL